MQPIARWGVSSRHCRPPGSMLSSVEPSIGAAMLVEIPIGNSVDRGDDAGVRPEQRLHLLDHAGDRMRLQADDDEILRPELGGIVGAARMHHALLIADQQFEPVGAHGGEMGAARHQADVDACARELHTEIAADRTGAVNADFHVECSRSWWPTICSAKRRRPEIIPGRDCDMSERRSFGATVRPGRAGSRSGQSPLRRTRSRCRAC